MKQASLELNLSAKKTRKREFLEQIERVVPWAALVALIAPYYCEGRTGLLRMAQGASVLVAAWGVDRVHQGRGDAVRANAARPAGRAPAGR